MTVKAVLSTVLLVFLASAANATYAQENRDQLPVGYPSRPIRLLVGLPAGGGIDSFMRILSQKLTERWGSAVVVDNRPGASALIAMEIAAKATPDGYTLLAGTNGVVTNTILGKASFDVRKAYEPIVKLASQPYILLVSPSVPVNSIKELIALAKSKPGSLSYASSGTGSVSHLGMELLKFMAGIDVIHVPYKGVGALGVTDLLGGRIQMLFSISSTATPLIKNGNVKALAVTSMQRSRTFPNLPTITESGVPDFVLSNDYTLYAPARTPPAIVLGINTATSQIMRSPDMRQKLEFDGMEAAAPNSPAEFRNEIAHDISRLEKFIKASGFKGE